MTIGNSDITLVTTRSRFLASDFLQSKDIEFSLNVDNIAQESNETFVLTLQLTSNDQFAGANVTIRDRLKVVIIDSDGTYVNCTIITFYVDIFSLQQKLPSSSLKLITPKMKNLMH